MLTADDYTRYGGKTLKTGGCFIDAKCATCGKKFTRSAEWAYKNAGSWFCSYSCMRVVQRAEQQQRMEREEKYLADMERRAQASRERKAMQRKADYAHRMVAAKNRVEVCEHWIAQYGERTRNTARSTREGKNARECLGKWRKKLREAKLAVIALEKEMEAEQNVQHTSEEEASC